jgi:hypothetical protein
MTGELILALTAILIAAVLVWFWLADDIAAFREEHRPIPPRDETPWGPFVDSDCRPAALRNLLIHQSSSSVTEGQRVE